MGLSFVNWSEVNKQTLNLPKPNARLNKHENP